jgi:hypothetical protein
VGRDEKGASLSTLFVGQCKFQVANVYKVWRNDRTNHLGLIAYDALPTPVYTALTTIGEGWTRY